MPSTSRQSLISVDGRLSAEISTADSAGITAFSGLRFSRLRTQFSSKFIEDKEPAGWDETKVGGPLVLDPIFEPDQARVRMGVLFTVGSVQRRSRRRVSYQSGKGLVVAMAYRYTVYDPGLAISGRARVGLFDEDDGLFLEDDNGDLAFVVRTSTSGSPVDTKIPRAKWNLDRLDGTGPSGKVLIADNVVQCLLIDFQWLGVGRVRFGFYLGGEIHYAHEVNNANVKEAVYIKTPNLPLTYYLENIDGSGATDMDQIASAVFVERTDPQIGKQLSVTPSVPADIPQRYVPKPLLFIRLKAGSTAEIEVKRVSSLSTQSAASVIRLHQDPVIDETFYGGTGFVWQDVPGSENLEYYWDEDADSAFTDEGIVLAGGLSSARSDLLVFGLPGRITMLSGDTPSVLAVSVIRLTNAVEPFVLGLSLVEYS